MDRGQSSRTGAAERAWCHEAVQDVSRTFALTIEALEEPMASRICVGYLLCRVADTVEDSTSIPPREQASLLRTYDAVLDPESGVTPAEFRAEIADYVPEDPDADWTVVAETPRVFRAFDSLDPDAREAIRPTVREMATGMASFVERYEDAGGLRIQSPDELEEYCWYVAGTVGELVTELLAGDATTDEAEAMRENARSFALLLQLVNVAKDVRPDYREENNVYLPATWLDEHDLDPEEVAEPSNASRVGSVVERVTDRARGYVDGAQRWLEVMPTSSGNTLAAWTVPFLLAVGTMRELRDRPGDVVADGDVKVSREEVAAVLERVYGDFDRAAIGTLRERIATSQLS
ncbi:phytoene/squalene synthase family protein [Halobacterium litoreum]|uniref:Phytoene/squalene synthase family protein n=1 Tax=Halobacterium litoreum TaxID=2039234 RepID=A0ABD5NHP8_9EURY|nr:phytoene/squalene synthase family protein [Halobacterium litoreum]UHH12336.1 squalene/phytoene synthase family protein [Halobacterium litoreum]